jgi:hypothetical protein
MFSFQKHARRDSNPQPTVLETATLPIELLALILFLFLLIFLFFNIPQVSRRRGTGRGRIVNP